MGITIQNVTGHTAVVIWPKMASCADSFYSVMYHPNWNSVLSSYSRKSFHKEERVPTSRSSFLVENLTPLTTYILCVTCQAASPSREQCGTFHTLQADAAAAGGSAKKELALGIWLTSSVLLLVIAAVLLYGCLHLLCRRRRERPQAPRGASEEGGGGKTWGKSAAREPGAQRQPPQGTAGSKSGGIQLATIIENPLACQEPSARAAQRQELVPATGPLSAVD
ncbi:FNDC9 protein, partial [Crypturellus soui]|nr:FNDC9 protein [Crypturellus soui]